MVLDPTLIAGLAAIASVITSGLVIWNFLQSPSKANATEIAKLRDQVAVIATAVTEHETTLKGLPTKAAFHDLQIATERMNGDVRVMGETLRAVKETSNLMRDWLLEKGVK